MSHTTEQRLLRQAHRALAGLLRHCTPSTEPAPEAVAKWQQASKTRQALVAYLRPAKPLVEDTANPELFPPTYFQPPAPEPVPDLAGCLVNPMEIGAPPQREALQEHLRRLFDHDHDQTQATGA